MHTCLCHGRSFRTIRGLKQHLNYTSNILATQSEACSDIFTKENIPSQYVLNIATSSNVNNKSDEIVMSKHKPLEIDDNVWLSDEPRNAFGINSSIETDGTECEEVDNSDFQDYVTHHITSLTSFCRTMFSDIENLKTNTKTTKTSNQELIYDLLSEIETLKNDSYAKDEIIRNIRTSDNYAINDVTQKSFQEVPRGARKHEPNKSTPGYPKLSNRYGPLRYVNNTPNETCSDSCTHTESNVTPYEGKTPSVPCSPSVPSVPNKRPLICITENHLNKFKPIRPGPSSWASSTRRGKRITILSDSMLQRIQRRDFNAQIEHGYATFKCYPGARPNEMGWSAIPHLIEETPHTIVINSGTNQLKRYDGQIIPSAQIADEVIDIGMTSRELGVKEIIISGIITRNAGMEVESRRREVNDLLAFLCNKNNFTYVDNDNISLDDICEDRVHLKPSGSNIVTQNLLQTLNSL